MVIYLYGQDTKRSREKLNALTEKFLKEVDPSGINLTSCDGTKLDPEALGQLLRAAPFLARRRMVVIERLFENKKDGVVDVLEHFMDSEPKTQNLKPITSYDDTIVVLWEDGTPKPTLAKKFAKLPHAQQFETLEKGDAPEWIVRQLKTQDVAIDPQAARALAERFPGNTWALSTELHKLAAYAKRQLTNDNVHLTTKDVDLLAGNFSEEPLYMLTAAIESGSLPDAAQRLHTFLQSGTPLLVLMSLIGKLLGNLSAEKRGGLAALKLHPYVEKKIRSLARRVAPDALTALLDQFLSLEYKMKTTRHNGEVEVLRFLDRATTMLSSRA